MTNKEIIEQINHFCVKKKSMCWGDSQCAYMLLSHSYLFVKPHKKGKKLVQNILSAIPKSTKKAIKNFYPCYMDMTLEEDIQRYVANMVFEKIQKSFDKEYFDKQCLQLIDEEEENDETLLDKYIYMLDNVKLKQFRDLVLTYGGLYNLFVEFDSWDDAEQRINEYCREKDSEVPEYLNEDMWSARYDEIFEPLNEAEEYSASLEEECERQAERLFDYARFIQKRPLYMFDYLSRDTVAGIYRTSISKDLVFAGMIAKALYYSDDYELIQFCTGMVCALNRLFGMQPYRNKSENPCCH